MRQNAPSAVLPAAIPAAMHLASSLQHHGMPYSHQGWLPPPEGYPQAESAQQGSTLQRRQWQEAPHAAADSNWMDARQQAEWQQQGQPPFRAPHSTNEPCPAPPLQPQQTLQAPLLSAPYGNDLQQPQPSRRHSLRRHSGMAPLVDAPVSLPPLHAATCNDKCDEPRWQGSPDTGSTTASFAALEAARYGASSRVAAEQQKAAYRAELAAQMAHKGELERQVRCSGSGVAALVSFGPRGAAVCVDCQEAQQPLPPLSDTPPPTTHTATPTPCRRGSASRQRRPAATVRCRNSSSAGTAAAAGRCGAWVGASSPTSIGWAERVVVG
jgi:hypothetical protein